MGYQCFHCLQDTVYWSGDFSFEDYGIEGEGIIHECTCSNCGARITYEVPINSEDSEEKDMGMEVTINSLEEMCALMCDNQLPEPENHYEKCLRCGRKLKSEESKIRGYGKTCERKMQSQSGFPLV